MSKGETIRIVAKLAAAFRKDQIGQDTVAVYVEHLDPIDPKLLQAAVEKVIAHATFFPSIAEVRHAALSIAGLLPPSKAEAMAIIRQADVKRPLLRRDGSFVEMEKLWEWPEGLSAVARRVCEETLAKVGEPSDEDCRPYFGWENGFQQTYELVASEVLAQSMKQIHMARLPEPPKVKALPKPEQWLPGPDDEPIPMCEFCGKHFGFGEKDGKKICLHCQLAPVMS